jgi:enamine deaminase RidA (YjgF/YER057c/UK114 family)
MANVASRYILEEPAVGGIIIGSRLGESEHIHDNLRLFQFSLDEASRSAIEEAQARLQPIPGDCGDEYRKPPFLTASGDLSHHLESFPPPYPVQSGTDGWSRVLSGTLWEGLAGYCRAVRHGDRILVSGTTATHGERVIGGADAAAQLHFVIDKVEGALQSLGGCGADAPICARFGGLGGRGSRPWCALWGDSTSQHFGAGSTCRRCIPRGDGGGGGGASAHGYNRVVAQRQVQHDFAPIGTDRPGTQNTFLASSLLPQRLVHGIQKQILDLKARQVAFRECFILVPQHLSDLADHSTAQQPITRCFFQRILNILRRQTSGIHLHGQSFQNVAVAPQEGHQPSLWVITTTEVLTMMTLSGIMSVSDISDGDTYE